MRINCMMINFSLIILLIFCVIHSMNGGRRVDTGELPYVVSIQLHMDHLCSGTIIDEYHILTTGHTVEPYDSPDLLVVTGLVMIRYPWITSSLVKNIFLHPDFRKVFFPKDQNDSYWENDIALLRLNAPLVWSPAVAPACLSTTEIGLDRCFGCETSSWNDFKENGLDSVILMSDVVDIAETSHCHQWGIYVLQNQHCFADLFGKLFITSKDIGSPIICGNCMVGFIARQGKIGATASPSTLLSTLSYADFITRSVKDGEFAVHRDDYPYVVSIWIRGKYLCSGIIVNAFQVITAGQCAQSSRGIYKPSSLTITAGSIEVSYRDSHVKWFQVTEITVHPLYKTVTYRINSASHIDHDLALITISKGFMWSPTINTFTLAAEDDFSNQQLCQLLHWKNINYIGKKARQLMKSNVILVDPETPNLQLRPFQFAAKSPYLMQVVDNADIGNPIICGGYPLGILIKVDSADEVSPMIFLSIRPYITQGFSA